MAKRHHSCRWDIETEAKIVAAYAEGQSMAQLDQRFEACHGSVRCVLLANGVKLRPRSASMRGKQNARKYHVNQGFFSAIDSEATAYVLGLLYADGWIRNPDGFGFSSTDRELPLLVKKALSYAGPVNSRTPTNPGKRQWELFIASRTLVADLIKCGCTPRKSLTLRFPDIPYCVVRHFIRGMWDGDGGIRKDRRGNARASLCGTNDILRGVAHYLNIESGLPVTAPHEHSRIYRLSYNGNGRAVLLREVLYQNATLFLKRKKEAFDNVETRYKGTGRQVRCKRDMAQLRRRLIGFIHTDIFAGWKD